MIAFHTYIYIYIYISYYLILKLLLCKRACATVRAPAAHQALGRLREAWGPRHLLPWAVHGACMKITHKTAKHQSSTSQGMSRFA